MTIDTLLLIIGAGMILVRRWAALLLTGFVGYCFIVAIELHTGFPFAALLGLVLLTPLVVTAAFWRRLVWADRLRDLLLLPVGFAAVAALHLIGFLLRPH